MPAPSANDSARIAACDPPPPGARALGYAAVVRALALRAPPLASAACSPAGAGARTGAWRPVDRKVAERLPDLGRSPDPAALAAHLAFALKHEGADLAVLAALFKGARADLADAAVVRLMAESPTGVHARRLFFLAEWLTGRTLPVADARTGNYVDAVDPGAYHALREGRDSRRHRVRDNLPGVPGFCPLVRRTAALERVSADRLRGRVREALSGADPATQGRLARFLRLREAKASFAIEGRDPAAAVGSRVARWGEALALAGTEPLSPALLARLNGIVAERRFGGGGFRDGHSWAGGVDADGDPWPDLVGVRPGDVPALVEAVCRAEERMRVGGVDAVAATAAVAFGLAFARPFEDGNYRVHRHVVSHGMAAAEVAGKGMPLPVSAAIERDVAGYRALVAGHSAAAMSCVDWRREDGGVAVDNDTADLYRYFDATAMAEYLGARLAEAADVDLRAELSWLRRWDAAHAAILRAVPLPAQQAGAFLAAAARNGGALPGDVRLRQFPALREAEVRAIEGIVRRVFLDGLDKESRPAPAAARIPGEPPLGGAAPAP